MFLSGYNILGIKYMYKMTSQSHVMKHIYVYIHTYIHIRIYMYMPLQAMQV